MSSLSVYLTTLFLVRISPLSVQPVCVCAQDKCRCPLKDSLDTASTNLESSDLIVRIVPMWQKSGH